MCIRFSTYHYLYITSTNPVLLELTSGNGIQVETIHRAFLCYTESSAQWFIPLLDDHVALHTMHTGATSRYVLQTRLTALKVLGALIAMTMILERAPVPIGPAILQFFLNERDLHSIHRGFLSEHHPYLRQTLDDWLNLGPEGDPSPFRAFFASYLSKEVIAIFLYDYHIIKLYSDCNGKVPRSGCTSGSRSGDAIQLSLRS